MARANAGSRVSARSNSARASASASTVPRCRQSSPRSQQSYTSRLASGVRRAAARRASSTWMASVPATLAAQESSPVPTVSDQLMTASDEQASTWTRNFNPLLPQGSSNRWPTIDGIYERLLAREVVVKSPRGDP